MPQVGLSEWNKLPEQERKPGAVRVEALSGKDAQTHLLYQRPPGMLIAAVYTRPMKRDKKGELSIGTRGSIAADPRTMLGLDHLWFDRGRVEVVAAGQSSGRRQVAGSQSDC